MIVLNAEYTTTQDIFTKRSAFILDNLRRRSPSGLNYVLYRETPPDPMDIKEV